MFSFSSARYLGIELLDHTVVLEKEMGDHSSILAWRILWTEECGGLLSIGLHRVRHDWRDLAAACIGEGNGSPLQYSCLENPVDGGAWWAAVHRVAQSQTWLRGLSMPACIGEGMATHSSVLAWRIPGTGEPGGLPSMGSHRVGHDWSNLAMH